MKIVVLPGVGLNKTSKKYDDFASTIAKKTGCEVETFYWHNGWMVPEEDLPLDSWRQWMAEVILDFQKVVKEVDDIKIPAADCYFGHSAGSVISLASGKPCVIFGSPVALLEPLVINEIINLRGINPDNMIALNVIHKYDILAHTIKQKNVENWTYSGSLLSKVPIWAHTDYWTNNSAINKMVSKVRGWQASGVLPNSYFPPN